MTLHHQTISGFAANTATPDYDRRAEGQLSPIHASFQELEHMVGQLDALTTELWARLQPIRCSEPEEAERTLDSTREAACPMGETLATLQYRLNALVRAHRKLLRELQI